MSQPRGRYAGSSDKNQRPSRRAKQSQRKQHRPPNIATSAQEPALTASIFKTRSFRFLVELVGAENIALGLGSNLARVAELAKGERFTPETAFHMETTLALPHGFFDQPNPSLAPETIARLKSPLDFVQAADDEPEADSETAIRPSAPDGGPQRDAHHEHSLSGEVQMPKKVTGPSPAATRNSRGKASGAPAARPPQKGPLAATKTPASTTRLQPLASADNGNVEKVRRANLHVLTARNGSKARLGVVMAMSGSNMAHRLYGKKRLDSVEADRFTERLGLPVGWLDTPRSEADIPESVARLLAPGSRSRASVAPEEPLPTVASPNVADASAAESNARTELVTGAGSADPDTGHRVANDEIIASRPGRLRDSRDETAGPMSEPGDRPLVADTTGTAEPLATGPTLHRSSDVVSLPQAWQSIASNATTLSGLEGIAPIAEALLKTLAGKARTGRLDELKALELLQRAVLL